MADSQDSLQHYVQTMTQHQGALRAFIVSLMPGSPDVGDVLQETNLILWQKREQFEEGSKFLAWAFTIARYEVMHHRDRVKRYGRLVFSDELLNTLSEPEQTADENEYKNNDVYLRALELCMAKLQDPERELISHRYTSGKSLEELAAKQSKSSGALRTSLFRVRAALKKCIDQQCVEGDFR